MKKLIPILVGAIAASAALPTTLAQAEELVLEEVIVTATRRVQNLQDVPMSVSAFTDDFFQDAGINNLADLEQYTPNLKIIPVGTDSNSISIRIRGIGSVGTNSGVDPSVGVFIDGIYQGRAGMSISDLIDVQRVEILRGPQGTLYGKNTAAGAISVVTNLPSPEFEALAEMNYDSDERLELRGMVNVPLGDNGHAMRLTAFNVDGDHLYENTYTGKGLNDANKWGTRGRFLFDLGGDAGETDFGELVFSLDYTNEDTDCCAIATIQYEGLSTLNAPATDDPSAQWQEMLGPNDKGKPILVYSDLETYSGFPPPKADAFDDKYWFDGPLYQEVEIGGVAAEWNMELANANTLTFINGWRFYESDAAFDGDFTAYRSNQLTTEIELDQYSSELRITSPGDQTFDYQGGLYFYYSELDSLGKTEQLEGLLNNAIVIPGLGLTMADFLGDHSVNTDTNTYTTTSYAAFGQLVWNISDSFSATLGLRYTDEEKEREGSQITNPPIALDIPPVGGPDLYYDDSRSDSNLSPSINLRYFFNPDVMGYALISRGFKSGGYDQRRQDKDSNGEFDEEIATNYELGWKSSWGGRRLQFNGTLFYVDYEDFQSQTTDGASIRVLNAGDMRSYGTELELVFIPVANMTMGTAIGYNKAEYESFDNGACTVEQTFYEYYVVQGSQSGSPGTAYVCTQDLSGSPVDNAPEWTVSSFLQYDLEFDNDLVSVLRLEHSYTDQYYLDQDLDEHLKNDAVNLVNFRLTLSNNSKTWEAAVWGRNLLDEEYYSWGLDSPTIGGYAGVVAPGEVYGITLRLIR